MTLIRAHEPHRFLPEPPDTDGELITVRAGEILSICVGAIDRQSGIAEIVAHCRSCENHDLTSTGRWRASDGAPGGDHYHSIRIVIPEHSPSVIWELRQISLSDRQGNRRTYHAGKDFAVMRFRVEGREGCDSTPPRLLGVKFGHA